MEVREPKVRWKYTQKENGCMYNYNIKYYKNKRERNLTVIPYKQTWHEEKSNFSEIIAIYLDLYKFLNRLPANRAFI